MGPIFLLPIHVYNSLAKSLCNDVGFCNVHRGQSPNMVPVEQLHIFVGGQAALCDRDNCRLEHMKLFHTKPRPLIYLRPVLSLLTDLGSLGSLQGDLSQP